MSRSHLNLARDLYPNTFVALTDGAHRCDFSCNMCGSRRAGLLIRLIFQRGVPAHLRLKRQVLPRHPLIDSRHPSRQQRQVCTPGSNRPLFVAGMSDFRFGTGCSKPLRCVPYANDQSPLLATIERRDDTDRFVSIGPIGDRVLLLLHRVTNHGGQARPLFISRAVRNSVVGRRAESLSRGCLVSNHHCGASRISSQVFVVVSTDAPQRPTRSGQLNH